jgi:single-strand DNA-binding protein
MLEVNHWVGSGRLGNDAELKETKSGTALASFSIANSRTVNGEERTSWIPCVWFGKRAEGLGPYLTKGKLILVQGELIIEEYEVEGQKRKAAKIQVSDVQFAEPKGSSDGSAAKSKFNKSGSKAKPKVKAAIPDDFDFDDDDEGEDAPF